MRTCEDNAMDGEDRTNHLDRARGNLELLQAQLDQLDTTNRALKARIENLHRDRDDLRNHIHALEKALHKIQSRRSHRFRYLIGNLLRRRLPVGEAIAQFRRPAAPPSPPPVVRPAFREDEPVGRSELIPEIEFPVVAPRRSLRVAAIMDHFSRAAFEPEFDYIDIGPDSWRNDLKDKPDLLMVESAFGGNNGKWVNQIAGFRPPRPALSELTQWCRDNGIPTVFWNKEDPSNYEWFIGAASAFDWVFTVDELSIDRYRTDLGHNRIAPLPFAAQPAIHHPPEDEAGRTGNVAFAGSYYARKHAERRRQMEIVLAPALEFGLDIFDRMGSLDDPRFAWPERYRPHLRGSLTYPQTTEAYRRYKVFLNVNTVTDSPTMCARRVFELLASGTPVITGPAEAIDTMVPEEAAAISRSADETREHLQHLLEFAAERKTMGQAGMAWIASGNTYSDRVNTILDAVGLT